MEKCAISINEKITHLKYTVSIVINTWKHKVISKFGNKVISKFGNIKVRSKFG